MQVPGGLHNPWAGAHIQLQVPNCQSCLGKGCHCCGLLLYCHQHDHKLIPGVEWQESPASTTVTTRPIDEVEFPAVTVCPPRGSNTALNQALEKANNINFTEEKRQELKNISREIFIEGPSKIHAQQMSELLSPENMQSIAQNKTSLPKLNKYTNLITLKSREPQGIFSTPGFGDSEYKGDFYNRFHSLQFVLQFLEILGNDSLVVSVQTDGEWSYSWQRMHFYLEAKNMTEAEEFCVSKGMHLASLSSKEEEDQLLSLLPEYDLSSGGKITSPVWK